MSIKKWVVVAILAATPLYSGAQTAVELDAIRGLSPVSTLSRTEAGRGALVANLIVTGGIQTGAITLPTLLRFPEQQQEALRDAYITGTNVAQLADGLGTALGAAYVARAHTIDRRTSTNLSRNVADLIAYASKVTNAGSSSAKFFFANETTDGVKPVSAKAAEILEKIEGSTDTFGRAYGFRAGAPGAGKYGDSRPFQTEPSLTRIVGLDYFNSPADNLVYLHGMLTDLTNSPSYPSGHTTYGYTGALLLAILVPSRYPEMMARGAEYGNDRIIIGAHYAMDVLGGRTLALYDVAHLLANDPAYVGLSIKGATPIKDFRKAVEAAREDMTRTLQAGCGDTEEICAQQDTGRFSTSSANESFYTSTQTYNLPVVYQKNAERTEDVGKLAPEAGYLLTVAFPSLTLDEADKILTETEGPGGGFLDNGSAFGIYSRLNLYEASTRARQLASKK
jgi:hypothetical protein